MNADVHALAGAYALDALPADEAAAFSEHVAACPSCRQEVSELRTTAGQLGLSVAEAPPALLRDRVLRAAQHTRQIPPVTPPTGISARRRRHRTRLLAAAAAAVVIVGAGLLALPRALDDGPGPRDPVAAVLNHPNAHSSTAQLRGGGSMTLVSSPDLHRAVVLSEDLPALERGRVYQLWLVDAKGDARSADVLIEDAGSRSLATDLVRGLRPGDALAITRERAGGAEQPTMTPLATVKRA